MTNQAWKVTFIERSQTLLTQLNINLNRLDHSKLNLLVLNDIKINYFESKTAIRFLVKVIKGNEGEYYLEPYYHNILRNIYTAIVDYKTNWEVVLHGNQIRISLPFLTTAKKTTYFKHYQQIGEQFKIQLRQIRQQVLNQIKTNIIAEDAQFQALADLQLEFVKYRDRFDEAIKIASDKLKSG